jgi:hypothetical protein
VYRISENNIETNDPVQPRQFPNGVWEVEWIEPRTNPYQRPFYIHTSAWQMMPVWILDDNGHYQGESGVQQPDYFYGLHYSKSNTTLGCIKIHSMDELDRLVEDIWRELQYGRKPILEVSNG